MTRTKYRKSYRHALTGSQTPTARITPEYDETDGGFACKILAAGDLYLDPWQADILDDWMAVSGGKWASKACGGSVPRQNGKTGLVQGRASAGMIMYGEEVLYTAHLQKTSTETFEEMASFFDSPKLRKYLKDIKTALGREQIILNNGARTKFLARTRNGGRGQHGDLLIFDEAQELSIESQASFIPAISASANPQTIYTGTPPDGQADGLVFRDIRKKALSGETKNSAWFEFSVPEIGDVSDRKRWLLTNPAIGRRILIGTIETELEQMPEDTFARERLGFWTPIVEKSIEYAIPADSWDACKSDYPKPDGKTAFGVKFSSDGAMVCLCGCVQPAEGPARISLLEMRPTGYGLTWLSDWLNARYQSACCVVIDGRNGVDVLIDKLTSIWRMKGSVIKAGTRDMIAAVGMLTDGINEKTLTWFAGQDLLRDSAITSTKRPIAGGWGFGGENSLPIEACALALFGVKTSKRDPSARMRIG